MFIRSTLLALVFAALSLPLRAAGLVDGTDYRTVDPPQHSDSPPGKIEVLEFFSWGCPHCNEFNPLITKWAENAPKDLVFKRVATGMGRTAWTNLAKAYYALESLGVADRLNAPIFHAIHEEHQLLVRRSCDVAHAHEISSGFSSSEGLPPVVPAACLDPALGPSSA